MYRNQTAATETRKTEHCTPMYKRDICTLPVSRSIQALHSTAPQKLVDDVLGEPLVGELHVQRVIHLHHIKHFIMTLANTTSTASDLPHAVRQCQARSGLTACEISPTVTECALPLSNTSNDRLLCRSYLATEDASCLVQSPQTDPVLLVQGCVR